MTRGRCIVVGGHCRGVGKTALVACLVRALADRRVQTVKVSAHRHGALGKVAIEEDCLSSPLTSTGRCLEAGARRAFLCRCPDGRLQEAADLVGRLSDSGGFVVVESNRIIDFVEPAATFFVISSHTLDWKASSWRCLPFVDAFVLAPGTRGLPAHAATAARPGKEGATILRFDQDWHVPNLSDWLEARLQPGRPGLTAPVRAGSRASRAAADSGGGLGDRQRERIY